MTDAAGTLDALRRHAAEAERLIREFRPAYAINPDHAIDTSGRPILLEMRIRLAEVYAAIAKLEGQPGTSTTGHLDVDT